MFFETLVIPSIMTTLGSIGIAISIGIRLTHIKKVKIITKITIGDIKTMKGKLLPKLRNLAKYIFVSNPITIGGVFTSILLLIANGITEGLIRDNLIWFSDSQMHSNLAFYGLVGLLGLAGAGKAGLESNKAADCRKATAKREKQEKRELLKAHKIACEQLAKEQDAERMAKLSAEQARFEQLLEQVKCELAAKAMLQLEQSERGAEATCFEQTTLYSKADLGQPKEHNWQPINGLETQQPYVQTQALRYRYQHTQPAKSNGKHRV